MKQFCELTFFALGRMCAPAGARARKGKSLEKSINKGNRPHLILKSRCGFIVPHLSGRIIVRMNHRIARTSYMVVNLPTPQYSATCTIGLTYPSHASCTIYNPYTSNYSYLKHLVFKYHCLYLFYRFVDIHIWISHAQCQCPPEGFHLCIYLLWCQSS